ncbi:fatty acid desaturase [Nostoc sp. FACHB-888]|uniref:fatty acid desaturase family protein n=1 Tax=Nostoc sp. FACHB-888 TaxID=2692842 RepID=UPI00168596E3|nr:fatty acid desaturase [Nostoc sp. FACHB-888]MBD2247487.1 fatty acid desaturase [Nostoc sp. FACHB-888]
MPKIHSSGSYRSSSLNFKEILNQLSEDQQKRIKHLIQIDPVLSILQYIKVYFWIAIAIAIGVYSWHPLVVLAVIVFIAGRQHSLYILNHDASHNLLFKASSKNKWVATVFSNLVMFHHPEAWSFVQWKRIHIRHHLYLFTDRDPNYVGRQKKGDTIVVHGPLKLIWLCIRSGIMSSFQFFIGRQDYADSRVTTEVNKGAYNHLSCLFKYFKDDSEMQIESIVRLTFIVLVGVVLSVFQWWIPFIVFWIVPMYTVYPMILTFMDLTEHRWTDTSANIENNTRSVRTGVLAKLIISALPRGFHREHHFCPRVAVTKLPELSVILCQEDVLSDPSSIKDLFKELA